MRGPVRRNIDGLDGAELGMELGSGDQVMLR